TTNMIVGSPDGSVDLYYDGSKVVETTTNGLYFGNGVSGANAGFLSFAGTQVSLKNYVHGGTLVLQGEDTGGTSRSFFHGDPDGQTTIYDAGSAVLATHSTGIRVGTSPSSTAELTIASDGGIATIVNKNHGFGFTFAAEDAGGTQQTLITADPDGETGLRYAGSTKLETKNGGVTVTGTLTADRLAAPDAGELTIASAAITVTGTRHTVDTESDAATDDLETINGGVDGALLILTAADAARTVVLKDNTGNLRLNGDFSLDHSRDTIMLMYRSANADWLELSRTDIDA
ncbi:MAG: hypothetical protein R3301_16210, partial [Saprospiraceae bacterium]|nr:hypothetical protein [Saprospiraceae bacterium]